MSRLSLCFYPTPVCFHMNSYTFSYVLFYKLRYCTCKIGGKVQLTVLLLLNETQLQGNAHQEMLNRVSYSFLHFILHCCRAPLCAIKQLLCSTPETHFISLIENLSRQQRPCQGRSAWLHRHLRCAQRMFIHMLTCCGHDCVYNHRDTKT